MPGRFILDANVLYSARLRDLFLELRVSGIAQVFWTEKIEAEWTRALVASRPDLQGAIEKTVRLIRMAFPLAYLADQPGEQITLGLPDPNDEHVAHAALSIGASIVTFNIADFPPKTLAPHGLERLHPDAALLKLAQTDTEGVLDAVGAIRDRLRNPPVSASVYNAGFAAAGCPAFSAWLRERTE